MGRYSLTKKRKDVEKEIAARLRVRLGGDEGYERFNVAPTQEVMAVVQNRDGRPARLLLRRSLDDVEGTRGPARRELHDCDHRGQRADRPGARPHARGADRLLVMGGMARSRARRGRGRPAAWSATRWADGGGAGEPPPELARLRRARLPGGAAGLGRRQERLARRQYAQL